MFDVKKVGHMVEAEGKASADAGFARMLGEVAGGDLAQFEALYKKERRRLYLIISNILRDPGLAEDALQETFMRIWRNASRFDREKGSARGWTATVARNVALDVVRSKKQFVELDAPEVSEISVAHVEPSDPKLAAALRALPPDQSRAIITMYNYGFSHSELASHLGAPLGSVKSWVRRGSETLRLMMESSVE